MAKSSPPILWPSIAGWISAPPNPPPMSRRRHTHLIDVFDPEHHYGIQHWLDLADEAAHDITSRGNNQSSPAAACCTPRHFSRAFLPAPATPLCANNSRPNTASGAAKPCWLNSRQLIPSTLQSVIRTTSVALCARWRCTGSAASLSSFHTTDGIRRDTWTTTMIGLRWDKEVLHRRINAR